MISFEKFQLKNGLKVIVHEDRSTPLAVVNILYDVGARDEHSDQTGFAHLPRRKDIAIFGFVEQRIDFVFDFLSDDVDVFVGIETPARLDFAVALGHSAKAFRK